MDEDDVIDDEDSICGWGAADFDDEILGRDQRKAASQLVSKTTKRKPKKELAHSNSSSELSFMKKALDQQHRLHDAEPPLSHENQSHKIEISPKSQPPAQRKPRRKQTHRTTIPQQHQNFKPSPRTSSILKDNVAIAALGRQRRMKVAADAMAANVPRKAGVASIVSTSFGDELDDDQEKPEMVHKRRPDEWLPSSAPQNQQEKLPPVGEPSTAPAGPIQVPKKIYPPLPLPLLSINSNCGGNETRSIEPVSRAPRHRRRQKNSLLPSKDVSENWESNFPPSLRRFPRKYQDAEPPEVNTDDVSSSFTRAVRVPAAPRQVHDTTLRSKKVLPSIYHSNKDSGATTLSGSAVKIANSPERKQNDKFKPREEEESAGDDGESWTRNYDDPEVIAKSMAHLIQALSTFASGKKHTKTSKGGKSKKRRTQLQQSQLFQQQIPVYPPLVRLPPPAKINVTSSRACISDEFQEEVSGNKRRKHRKLRKKNSSDGTNHSAINQVP